MFVAASWAQQSASESSSTVASSLVKPRSPDGARPARCSCRTSSARKPFSFSCVFGSELNRCSRASGASSASSAALRAASAAAVAWRAASCARRASSLLAARSTARW